MNLIHSGRIKKVPTGVKKKISKFDLKHFLIHIIKTQTEQHQVEGGHRTGTRSHQPTIDNSLLGPQRPRNSVMSGWRLLWFNHIAKIFAFQLLYNDITHFHIFLVYANLATVLRMAAALMPS